jgi:hypothetical protein
VTVERQRDIAVFHSITAFDDFVVAVQRARYEIAFSSRAATVDPDAVRAGNDFSAVAG